MGKGKGKEKGMGERKRKQPAISDRDSKLPRIDGASSSTSAPPGNGGGRRGSPEDLAPDNHSVSQLPPSPQARAPSIEAQGEPPTEGSKWNFNLEEGTLPPLPPVPAACEILQALPSEEEPPTLVEALFMAMIRCCEQHRVVG